MPFTFCTTFQFYPLPWEGRKQIIYRKSENLPIAMASLRLGRPGVLGRYAGLITAAPAVLDSGWL